MKLFPELKKDKNKNKIFLQTIWNLPAGVSTIIFSTLDHLLLRYKVGLESDIELKVLNPELQLDQPIKAKSS